MRTKAFNMEQTYAASTAEPSVFGPNDRAVKTYRVRRSRLEGTVDIAGAKNCVLKLLAATLLSDQPIEITNFPASLLDVRVHLGMLEALGKRVHIEGDKARIVEVEPPPSKLKWPSRSIRNTLLILGALTARTGGGSVPLPGGCKLGERKHDLHVMLLKQLGAEVWETETGLEAYAPHGLNGTDVYLPLRSTGATENAILCGTLARGRTTVWNPHVRPEIIDLIRMLRTMGAQITGYGQERIEIIGSDALQGAKHRVIPDNMEALTWLIGACITHGDVEICGFPRRDLEVPLIHLKESGARLYFHDDSVIVRGGECYPVEISTGTFPGINSDMQPLFAIFGAMSRGESRIIDLRFPGRYLYAEELARMGLNYSVHDNLLRISGGKPLAGADVTALDLRAGVALTLAGLVADGETVVHDAWQIERGYDRFVSKLRALGGQIETDA